MKLCVGATSRIVVEEAAKLHVPQIVASRRQVDETGGYIGLSPSELVAVVAELSEGATKVVRDHGGPHQNGNASDDWVSAFDLDVESGFDSLHIDVCKLPRDEQVAELLDLVERYAPVIDFEIGGERDEQAWLDVLLKSVLDTGAKPTYAVLDVGGHAWADRQRGFFRQPHVVADETRRYHDVDVLTKAHNMDWAGCRQDYADILDAYNVAPEFAAVEIDSWLRALPPGYAQALLEAGYNSHRWERWFGPGEGTPFEKARCALRYIWVDLVDPHDTVVIEAERLVRQEVRDALAVG